MKISKSIVLIPLIIIMVIAMSGCITDSLFKEGQTFEQNGITFQYPDSWQTVKSVAEGSVAAVAKMNDSQTSTVIQQVPSDYGTEIQQACSTNNINLIKSPNYINVQETQTTVNGKDAIVHRYIVNEADGSQKEHVATWIKMEDNKVYVLLFSTPVGSYESEKSNYDMIAGSFALQNATNNNAGSSSNSNGLGSDSSSSQDSSIMGIISNQLNKFFSS